MNLPDSDMGLPGRDMSSPGGDQANPDPYEDLVAQCLDEYLARVEAGETAVEASSLETTAPLEVQERIRRAKEGVGLIESLALQSRPAGDANRRPARRRRAAGKIPQKKRIARFQILEELGVGGFGIVYRAWDPHTDRLVALKIPRIETLASTELQQRFEQEARAAAKLDHPNIVSVLEAGTAGMLPYIASVYYSGVTLADWLRDHRQPIAPRLIAGFIRMLAAALAHAHDRGVLHRDIKPSNILLVAIGAKPVGEIALDEATPKLMDFGLAKLADAGPDMTTSGALLGTIRYMPPEQAAGRTKQIGPASDVYSLGTVLYELLAGEPPFTADSDVEVLRKIALDEPSRMDRTRLKIPIDLETICLTCLEKEPARRYPSAQALADDLDRFVRGEPIAARRAGTAERLAKWSRRNPALAGLVVTAIVATALLVGGLLWSNMTISSALRATEEQRELTVQSAELATQRERVARKYAYNVDMRLAQQAWNNGSPGETRNLLAKHKPSAGQEDLRGFEWRQMWDELDRYSQVVATQPTPMASLTAAGDDRSFATGDHDGTIRLWGLAPPGMLREWHAHDGIVTSLVFCQGGQVLVSAGADHTIRFWQVATGEMIRVLDEHRGSVNMLALSAGDEHLVSGGDDGRVLEWNLQTGDVFKELYRHESAVRWVVAHPREPWGNRFLFASGSDDGEVRMWDFFDGKLNHFEATVPVSRNAVIDGKDFLWSSVASKLIGWKYNHTNKPGAIEDRIKTRETLWIAAVGDYLLEAGKDPPEIHVRSLIANEDRRVVRNLRGHTGAVRYLAALAERDSFLSGSDDGTVRRWQLTIADESIATIDLAAKVTCSGWAPDSDQIVLGLDDGRVFLVDATLTAR